MTAGRSLCIGTLIGFGYVLVLASSPAVAHRIGDPRDMLILKQVAFLAIAGRIVIGVSMLPPKGIRWLALIGTIVAIMLTAFTLVHGVEIKGARRWINIPFLSLQPSEFLKPFFAVVTAGLLVEARRTDEIPRPPACRDGLCGDRAAAEVAAGYRHARRHQHRVPDTAVPGRLNVGLVAIAFG